MLSFWAALWYNEKYTGIKNIEDESYDGLEIMTTLDSKLDFESQTLVTERLEQLAVSEHTTGEALENGQYEVELQDDCFEIYLELPQ